jgi:glycosyltransferase involved in cell wall biosynthesis
VYNKVTAPVTALGKLPSMPSVSIILPTFNRTSFLKLAVESVFAQTFSDWEMIIADDGSGEDTAIYLQSILAPRVRIIRLAHSGNPSKVRNSAIRAAGGRYLAFLDSDDVWAPSKLEKQIVALANQPNSRWSYTLCDHIDESGRLIPKERPAPAVFSEGWVFEPLLRLQFSIAMPTLVAERDLVHEVGGFDEQQRFGEFHDLCLRLAMNSQAVAVRESLCSVRTHNQHYSSDRVAAQKGWMRLYEKMAALAPDPNLRGHCARMRAETSLVVARLQSERGDFRALSTTLGQALPFSLRYPRWWCGAIKEIVRAGLSGVFTATSSRQRRHPRPPDSSPE